MTLKNMPNSRLYSVALFTLISVPSTLVAFSIDNFPTRFHGAPIHENITRSALLNVEGSLSSTFVDSVIGGNTSMDRELRLHKFNGYKHVNSATATNPQFDTSNAFIEARLDKVSELASENSRFRNPEMYNYGPFKIGYLSGLILEELGLSAIEIILSDSDDFRASFSLLFNNNVDPVSNAGNLMRNIRVALDRRNPNIHNDLQDLVREFKGHEARKYLGHAFHTLQDFAAHSNVIELLHDKNGPPCFQRFQNNAKCDTPIGNQSTDRFSGNVSTFLMKFSQNSAISKSNLSRMLGPSKFERLQTGFVRDGFNFSEEDYCEDQNRSLGGFRYCHWSSDIVPGLNKDKGCANNECSEPAHLNHRHAFNLAVYLTEIVFENILRDSGQARTLPNLSVSTQAAGKTWVFEDSATVELVLDRPAPYNIRFAYGLGPGNPSRQLFASADSCGGTYDFVLRTRFSYIQKGETRKAINLDICNDELQEQEEVVSLNIRNWRSLGGPRNQRFNISIAANDARAIVVTAPKLPTVRSKISKDVIKNLKPTNNSGPNAALSCSVLRCRNGQVLIRQNNGKCVCK